MSRFRRHKSVNGSSMNMKYATNHMFEYAMSLPLSAWSIYIRKLYLTGTIYEKSCIPVYMLGTGNENAAIENERIPSRAHTDSERRRFGKTHTANIPNP